MSIYINGTFIYIYYGLNPASSFLKRSGTKAICLCPRNLRFQKEICSLVSTFWSSVFNDSMADTSMSFILIVLRHDHHELVPLPKEEYVIFHILYILCSCNFLNAIVLKTQSGFCLE